MIKATIVYIDDYSWQEEKNVVLEFNTVWDMNRWLRETERTILSLEIQYI